MDIDSTPGSRIVHHACPNIKERVQAVDPNGGRCLVENCSSTRAIQYYHLVPRNVWTDSGILDALEWHWNMRANTLNLDTRRNVFPAGASVHHMLDTGRWVLVPEEAIVQQYYDALDPILKSAERARFPIIPDCNDFQYTLIPIKDMEDIAFTRQMATGGPPVPDNFVTHLFPYNTFPFLTNIAMLTVLNEFAKWRNEETGEFDLDGFKMVYIAPMKAFVQEMVGNFQAHLKVFVIKAGEFTGDYQRVTLIAETQIIVTTPEKWDVITRKGTNTSYTNLVRLIIIDKSHLLHDDHGPVLEAIIARTIRQMEQTNEHVRLSLSTTLSNYQDVATFLHVDEKKGLVLFRRVVSSLWSPAAIYQYHGENAIKRYQLMSEISYKKETAKTTKFLCDMAVEKGTITQFIKPEGATREILTEDSGNRKDRDLLDLPFPFTIHHAGMSREDRTLVEDLFAEGHVQYDTFGEGVIVTNLQELQDYLSLLNQQSPVEGQFVSGLVGNLNAEVVLGTIRTSDEMVQWLGYMYVRTLKDPGLYGISIDYQDEFDPCLIQKQADIIHSAAVLENSTHRIRAQFGAFVLSNEFKLLPVGQEIELLKLLERVLIPIKESVEDPVAEINVLLQAPLDAMFEICLKRGWAIPAKAALDICKMIEKRMWGSMNPSRQFEGVSAEIIRKAEGKQFVPFRFLCCGVWGLILLLISPWYRYFDLTPPEIGELIGIQNPGKLVHDFPKLQLQAQAQLITCLLLLVDLSIISDFRWDEKIHSGAETFIIFVEDVDGYSDSGSDKTQYKGLCESIRPEYQDFKTQTDSITEEGDKAVAKGMVTSTLNVPYIQVSCYMGLKRVTSHIPTGLESEFWNRLQHVHFMVQPIALPT
ncbi:Pre-mRNA-splicing factor brr2 [Leucoagaricus sp. SymC.cos]|nr:Pre-mRNA-splicing factor brr2 [Leucoagaricus sp. SymC.cos]